MPVYYNENDPVAAHVLECLVQDHVIADGVVDRRSIVDVDPKDLAGFAQCHFFAGGGLWSVAARMAGWPDDAPLWSGSCPCQPFSVAGKGLGEDDPRHLWPHFFRLIRACRPPVVVGEQVAGAAGYRWFDGVAADLEGEDYACRAVDTPACAVNAPHIRQRLYWCAVKNMDDATGSRRGAAGCEPVGAAWDEAWRKGFERRSGDGCGAVADACGIRKDRMGVHGPQGQHVGHGVGTVRRGCSWDDPTGSDEMFGGDAKASRLFNMADSNGRGRAGRPEASQRGAERGASLERIGGDMADAEHAGPSRAGGDSQPESAQQFLGHDCPEEGGFWSDYEWRTGADGKARRVKPGVRLLVDGLPGRVGLLRIAGNAIVAPLAAQVLAALIETQGFLGADADE